MPFFDIFASPRCSPLRMRTKVASFFIFFQELSNKKKIKALRPKMTKIASRGSCLNRNGGQFGKYDMGPHVAASQSRQQLIDWWKPVPTHPPVIRMQVVKALMQKLRRKTILAKDTMWWLIEHAYTRH